MFVLDELSHVFGCRSTCLAVCRFFKGGLNIYMSLDFHTHRNAHIYIPCVYIVRDKAGSSCALDAGHQQAHSSNCFPRGSM